LIQKTTARPPAPARPVLLTPAFVSVTLAALAYFTADGILIPAVPRYTSGPLGGGDVAVGLVVGAFSASAFFLRAWAGGLGDRWGRRPLMVGGAGVFAVSVLATGWPRARPAWPGCGCSPGRARPASSWACSPPWPTWPRPSAGARR
jgi:MFS family permease